MTNGMTIRIDQNNDITNEMVIVMSNGKENSNASYIAKKAMANSQWHDQ